jgi:hypothetical protein
MLSAEVFNQPEENYRFIQINSSEMLNQNFT